MIKLFFSTEGGKHLLLLVCLCTRNEHCLINDVPPCPCPCPCLQEQDFRRKPAAQHQQMTPDQSQQPSLGSTLDPSSPSTPSVPTTPPQLGRTLSGSKPKVSSGRRVKRYSTGEEGGAPNGVTRTSSGVYDRWMNSYTIT